MSKKSSIAHYKNQIYKLTCHATTIIKLLHQTRTFSKYIFHNFVMTNFQKISQSASERWVQIASLVSSANPASRTRPEKIIRMKHSYTNPYNSLILKVFSFLLVVNKMQMLMYNSNAFSLLLVGGDLGLTLDRSFEHLNF